MNTENLDRYLRAVHETNANIRMEVRFDGALNAWTAFLFEDVADGGPLLVPRGNDEDCELVGEGDSVLDAVDALDALVEEHQVWLHSELGCEGDPDDDAPCATGGP